MRGGRPTWTRRVGRRYRLSRLSLPMVARGSVAGIIPHDVRSALRTIGGSVDQELIARSMRELAREFDSCRDMLVALGNENRQLIFMALLESHGGARPEPAALPLRAARGRPHGACPRAAGGLVRQGRPRHRQAPLRAGGKRCLARLGVRGVAARRARTLRGAGRQTPIGATLRHVGSLTGSATPSRPSRPSRWK